MNTLPPDPRANASAAAYELEQQPYGLPVGVYGPGAFGELMRYVLAVVRRNRWLILAIIGLALVAALIATMLDTPRYTATTSVQINDQSDQVLGDELDDQSAELAKSTDVERFLNTQVEIMRSRGLSERVARRLELIGNERFYTAMEIPPPAQRMSEAERREQVITLLQNNMTATLPRNSRIATIAFSSADADLSAKIANAYAEEFIQANLQRRFDSSAYARNFISEQLEEARGRLESSEREVNAYARSVGLIRTRDNSSDDKGSGDASANSVTTSSLMQINQAANTAKADRIEPTAWRALWVGGGAMEGMLRDWAARHGDRVRIVTGVGHDRVPGYLNAMDLLAAPSQTTPRWKEQFGRMLLEAMAAGVPVVASDSGEIPHVVKDAGRVVPAGRGDEEKKHVEPDQLS